MRYPNNPHQVTPLSLPPPPSTINGTYHSYTNPVNVSQPPQFAHPHSQPHGFVNSISYQPVHNFPPLNYSPHSFFAPTPQPGQLLSNNMQWDPNILSRYAEYQLQQNHQKQQRALLERQRQQLAELGVPVEDKSLLDQLLRSGVVNTETAPSGIHPEPAFEWPTVNGTHGKEQGQYRTYNGLGQGFVDHQEEGTVWPTTDDGPFPSPASAGDPPKREKRDFEKEREGGSREGKRSRAT